MPLRFAYLAAGLLCLSVAASLWVSIVGPAAVWSEFVDFSNQWGNVASVIGLLLTIVGFGITFNQLWLTRGEQRRIRGAVTHAVERAAGSVLSNLADEAVELLLEFKDEVRRGAWHRAGEKCDDAQTRVTRMLGNPQLAEKESENLQAGADELRLVSRYIITQKSRKPGPTEGFHQQKLDIVDRLLAALRAIQARLQKKSWEV